MYSFQISGREEKSPPARPRPSPWAYSDLLGFVGLVHCIIKSERVLEIERTQRQISSICERVPVLLKKISSMGLKTDPLINFLVWRIAANERISGIAMYEQTDTAEL